MAELFNIGSLIEFLRNLLYTGSALLLFLIPVLLWTRARQRLFAKSKPADNRADELPKMMILLQTMRDLLREQKDLARKLNQSLDGKVHFIKDSVAKASADMEKLRKTQRELMMSLADARKQRASVQTPTPTPTPTARPRSLDATVGDSQPQQSTQPSPSKPLQAIATPQPSEPAQTDLLDQWVGLDLGEGAIEEPAFEVPVDVPEQADEPEAARDAFRALLDMVPTHTTDAGTKPRVLKDSPPKNEAIRKNGLQASYNGDGHVPHGTRTKMTPLEKRVCEYSDAGMSVGEIARELGMGKGEIRLILNLRKDKEA